MNQGPQQNDVPASVAMVAAVALAGAWLYFRTPILMERALKETDAYAELHLTSFAVLLFATTINSVWAYSVFSRSFGISRQGQRLEILAKGSLKKTNRVAFSWVSLAVSFLLSPAIYLVLRFFAFADFPSFVPPKFFASIWLALSLDLSVSLFICLSAMERGGLLETLRGNAAMKLPELPSSRNAIVLGAVEEVALNA